MKFRVELKAVGQTVFAMETEDMTEKEVNARGKSLMDEYSKNPFVKDLPLEVVITPI